MAAGDTPPTAEAAGAAEDAEAAGAVEAAGATEAAGAAGEESGIGREGGREGLLPFLETKFVILEGRPAGYENTEL
jgi:hypothetical protein